MNKKDIFKKVGTDTVVNVDELRLNVLNKFIIDSGVQYRIFLFGDLEIKHQDKEYSISCNMTSVVTTEPSDVKKIKGNRSLFLWKKDDIFISGDLMIKDISNVELIFSAITSGAFPRNMSPDNIADSVFNAIQRNESLDVDRVEIETIIAEIIRSEKDPTKPFRITNDKNWTMMNFRESVSQSGTWNGLTFEDPNMQITSSLVRSKDSEVNESLIEKYSKM